MEKTKVVSKGIGFGGLLTILFIALKLCNVIEWSWVWVLAPLWISWAFGIVMSIIMIIITLVVYYRD